MILETASTAQYVMEPYLATTLGGLVVLCSGVIITLLRNLGKKSADHDKAFSRIETLMTGATGENGLCGDVKTVKHRTHELATDMQFVFLKLGVERRVGSDDRRASA